MGIRFNCPHCSGPLNVKTSQAGLDALCPYCREILTIAAQTSPAIINSETPAQLTEENQNSDSQVTQYGLNQVSSESVSLLTDFGLPEPGAKEKSNRRFRSVAFEESKSAFLLDKPALRSRSGKTDPIADAPNLIWYYRLKNQPEQGPLKAKVMLAELDAGKIVPGSLVWREDWETWLPAEQVFPQLRPKTNDSSTGSSQSVSGGQQLLTRMQQLLTRSPIAAIVALVLGMLLLLFVALTFYKFTQ